MTGAVKMSVAIPAYNRPEYLSALVGSVPTDIDVFVSDNDGSLTARLPDFSNNVCVKHADEMLPIFRNWNSALSLVSADSSHVVIPSDDDIFVSDAFSVMQSIIGVNPDVDVFIFGCDLIDGDGVTRAGYRPESLRKYEPGEGFFVFQHGVDARMPGIVFRKDFLERVGAFDERFKLTAADSELIQRALILGRSLFVPDVVAYYRVWPGGLTHSRQATDEWMQEIQLWAEKTTALIRDVHGEGYGGFDALRFRDELLAQNLLSGIGGLLARGEFDVASRFLRSQGVPKHARLLSRMRLFRQKLRILMVSQP